jgi:hypothetical protein
VCDPIFDQQQVVATAWLSKFSFSSDCQDASRFSSSDRNMTLEPILGRSIKGRSGRTFVWALPRLSRLRSGSLNTNHGIT